MRRKTIALARSARVPDGWFYEEPVEFEIANPSSEISFERIGRNEAFAGTLVAVRQGPLRIIESSFVSSSKIKCVPVTEAEFLDTLKKTALAIFPHERKVERRRIEVLVEIPNRDNGVVRNAHRTEPENPLSNPEPIIGYSFHDFVPHRRWSGITARGIEISGKYHGIVDPLKHSKKRFHLPLPAPRGTFVLQVNRNDR